MDCSPPGSSAHGIFQARVLEWGAIAFSVHLCYTKVIASPAQLTLRFTVIQVYAQTSNTEEAEVEQFYEDLQDLLELTPQKDVLFIIGDWTAKV